MRLAGAHRLTGRRAIWPRVLACAVVAFALCAGAAGARHGDGPASRTAQAAGRVNIWFDVVDRLGLQVKSLRPEDVRVSEGGVAQRIEFMELRPAATRSVVLLVDTSISQERVLPAEKQIARALVARLVRPGRDRVAVVSFAGETTLEQEFTPDAALARQTVEQLKPDTPESYVAGAILTGRSDQPRVGSTSLADALWLVGKDVFATAPAGSRPVLVLITDGNDTSSQTKKRDAFARLHAAGATVFAVGVADGWCIGCELNKGELKSLAARTGGRAFFPRKEKDLTAKDEDVIDALDSIERSLEAQYLLSYTPTGVNPKEKSPKLKIEIVNPELRAQGLRVNHAEVRPAAQAPADKSASK